MRACCWCLCEAEWLRDGERAVELELDLDDFLGVMLRRGWRGMKGCRGRGWGGTLSSGYILPW